MVDNHDSWSEKEFAKKVSDRTEAACRRSDLFERRRRLMDDSAGCLADPS